jgi:hypothetical protein
LEEGKADDEKTKDGVRVVLWRTADKNLGLHEMDESAQGTLQQIEYKDSDTPFLMTIERTIKEV